MRFDIIGDFVDDLSWRDDALYWSRDGVLHRKATLGGPIRWAVSSTFDARPGVLVILDKQARVLFADGRTTVVNTPQRLDRCWALDNGVLAQGDDVWTLRDLSQGFTRVKMSQGRILHVDHRVFYEADDLIIGSLENTMERRESLEYDVTMHAGLVHEPRSGEAIVPKSKIRIKPFKIEQLGATFFAADGKEVADGEGLRLAARDMAIVGQDSLLLKAGLVLHTQQGLTEIESPIPNVTTLRSHPKGVVLDNGNEAVLCAGPMRAVHGASHAELHKAPVYTPLDRMQARHRTIAVTSTPRARDPITVRNTSGDPPIADKVLGRQSSSVRPDVYSAHMAAIQVHLEAGDWHAVVEYLVGHRLSHAWLQQLPPELSIPILEALRVCRMHPRSRDPRVLARIGRRDLARQAQPSKSYDQLSRFGADKRLEEVDRIMQTSRLRVVDLPVPPGVEVNVYRQTMANTLAQRTMATTIGNGAYLYGTKAVDLSRALEVPSIETTVRFASDSFKAPVEDWPRFHNGVAAALAIQGQVDKSWIMHCKPPQLDPEYGGVLLGLGLRRQLGKLRTFDAFSLLESRHEQTTVGLLLGLAAQHIGSKDQTVTKMLSLHTRAFLPMGSVDLNASSNVQASAMLGLGLTHMASGNMRMAKVAKKEISGDDEAYGFSSAMAFGLIMLGRGGDIELRHLYTTIHGPGAILATGLMHLKQGGDYITMPESSAELDTMPPESLLYRVYAQSLIRWDAQPTVEWVHSQVPRFIHDKDVGYMHIIAGACMAIGVKYAGTASESALNTILGFYGNLQRHAASSDTSYEGKIRRRASRQAIDVVTIAMCAVMSGTGEIGVLRRIRIAHGQEGAGINYGTHVALHLALGLLFLGKGYYTLGATDLAVAAMTIAFFPRTGGYLEVFRHLWALAAEPRCLVARDADTGKIENVPLRVTMREPSREQKLMSPTLVSPFEQISEVVVDSVRYWPVQAQDSTIYVQKRSAFLDYSRDNKGTRSIHARVGSLTGFDMHYDLVSPAAPPAIAAAEVIELVYQHTTDTLLHGYARVFAGTGGEFSRAVLLECLVLDKPEAMVPYHILRKDGERGLRQYYKVDFPKLHDDRTLPLIRAPFLAAVASITGVAWPEDEAKRAIASGEDSNLVAMRVYEAVKNYERMTFGKTCRLVDTL